MTTEAGGISRAKQFLSTLQDQGHTQFGPAEYPRNDEVSIRVLEQVLTTLRPDQDQQDVGADAQKFLSDMAALRHHIGPYESPEFTSLMTSLIESIEKSLDSLEWPKPTRPVFGTLPIGQISAVTFAVPRSGTPVIVFEPEVFMFALLLSKSVALCFPVKVELDGGVGISTDRDRVHEWIVENGEAVERFWDMLLAFVVAGSPSVAQPYVPPREYTILAQWIRSSMELFMVGHEYAHLLINDFEGDRNEVLDGHEVDFEWEQEFAADAYGLQLSIDAAMRDERIDLPLALGGADLFFSAIEIMDKAISLLHQGDEEAVSAGSHPPAANRRALMRQVVRDAVGEESADEALQFCYSLEHAINLLWSEVKPRVERARFDGLRPAEKWIARLVSRA